MPVQDRFNQYVGSMPFKYVTLICLDYPSEVFEIASDTSIVLRNTFRKLKGFFRQTIIGQNSLSYIDSSLWNKASPRISEKKLQRKRF